MKDLPYTYCPHCFKPFHTELEKACKSCGSSDKPVDLFKKVSEDGSFTSKERRWLNGCGWLSAFAHLFNIAYNIGFSIFIYSTISWDSISASEYLTNENILSFIALVIMMSIFSVISAVGIGLSVPLILKRARTLEHVLSLCKFLVVNSAIFGNLISPLISSLLVHNVKKVIQKAEHGFAYDEQGNKLDDKQTETAILNYNEWKCKNCGYINDSTILECKSCGKFK